MIFLTHPPCLCLYGKHTLVGFLCPGAQVIIFNKPPLSIADQIIQWESRGLAIPDRTCAERYLSVISYYRLSAYTLPFQKGKPDHFFKPGINFEDILEICRRLRRRRTLKASDHGI